MVNLAPGHKLERQLSALRKSVREILEESEKLDLTQMTKVMAELEDVGKFVTERSQKALEVKGKEFVLKQAQEAFRQYMEHNAERLVVKFLQKHLEYGTIREVPTSTGEPQRSEDGATNVLRKSTAMLDKSSDHVSLFSDQVQKTLAEALLSPQSSLQLLIDAGIADRDGKLNSKYLVPEQVDDPKGPREGPFSCWDSTVASFK